MVTSIRPSKVIFSISMTSLFRRDSWASRPVSCSSADFSSQLMSARPREAVMSSCSTMANGQGRQSCLHVQQWPMAKGCSHVFMSNNGQLPREAVMSSCQTMANGQGRLSCLHVKQWTMAKGGSHVFMLNNGQWPREAVMSSC